MPICPACQTAFEITDTDKAFYIKMDVPEPSHCPDCRLQRRMAFRNERTLYKRKCDFCGREIASTIEGGTFPVYCMDCWWSDKWDPLAYGQDIDWNRPFFDQFADLMARVPKSAFLQVGNENCEYNALIGYSKNSYMCAGSHFVEDCIYCRKSQYSRDCVNSNLLDHCELTAVSTNSKNCYSCHHLINSRQCVDSSYLADCANLKNCFMCSGLVSKEFHFKNRPLTEEEYKKIKDAYAQKSEEEIMQEFLAFDLTIPKRYQSQANCENSTGNYLYNSKNAIECYDSIKIEDSAYIVDSENVKDSMDLLCHDKDIERCYELSSGGDTNVNMKFSFYIVHCSDSAYLYGCFYLNDCFGCDGVHSHNKNLILNKKYDEVTYKNLKSRLTLHMKKTGEYGEFFPARISIFGYNETLAMEAFPLTREEALQKGFKWKDEPPKTYLPAGNGILACKKCGKNYKILPQEAALNQKIGVAPSPFCFECRHANLVALKNPKKLFDRTCANCGQQIKTTYPPTSPYKVFCESCYLKTIY